MNEHTENIWKRLRSSGRIRVRPMERMVCMKRLSAYIRAGIPLLEALYLTLEIASRAHAQILVSVIGDVQSGLPLSKALRKFPQAYRPLETQLIGVGEMSGTLPDALLYLSDILMRRMRLVRKIYAALTYPLIILVGTIAISGFLVFYAFPKIVPLFQGLHAELPLPTRVLMWVSSFVAEHGLALCVFCMAIVLGSTYAFTLRPVKERYNKYVLQVPLVGAVLRSYYLASLFRVLGVLLKSGVRIDVALSHTGESVSSTAYRISLKELEAVVLSGKKITLGMRETPRLYPATVIHILSAGEMTGTLAESARTVSEMYEEALEEQLESLSTFLEPLLMLGMGLAVGFIALAIISPMYALTQNISIH